ncbi:hypothetical protein M758_12G127800 [Ceratodon purpureus]|nr:hypothetical protein M758_12G127800 [Ceratodon purpureus]
MQWEDDEDDEVQAPKATRVYEEKRHYQGRASNGQQHRRKELPVYEDPFTKRLGRRSASVVRERAVERNGGFATTTAKTTEAPKWTSFDEIPRSSARNNEVIKVDKSWCNWPCTSEGLTSVPPSDGHKASRSTIKQPQTKSPNAKEPRSLGALLTRKFFRSNNINETVSYPAWENEWALFREQHELEMKQMKQMYMGLQEICLELKKMGTSQKDDGSAGSSSRRQSTESMDSKVDGAPLLGQSKRHAAKNYAPYVRENGHHQPNRRAKSAPKTRVNWDTGLTKENSMHVRVPYGTSWYCPTAALFEEIVQVERVYIRNFVAALIRYEEGRFQIKDDFQFEQIKGDSLREVIDRLLPHANFSKPWHYKYGIEAWLSRIVFKEFGKAGLINKSEEKGQDARAKRNDSWEEYQRLSLLSPVDAINPEGKVYCGSFHLFCNRKFDNIQSELKWQEEWPDNLVKDFLEAMKHVWRAHKLALAFDPVASLFSVKATAQFDVKFMEPLETPTIFQADSFSPYPPQVGFLVNPGFIVLERIIKCQVYLSPDDSFDDSS